LSFASLQSVQPATLFSSFYYNNTVSLTANNAQLKDSTLKFTRVEHVGKTGGH